MSYSIYKTSLEREKPYTKAPKWVIKEKATIYPKTKDKQYFPHSITVALNHQNIENHVQRLSNIKPFINQYNWEGIKFPVGTKYWKNV